jgi:DNA (cytosine-5)-methyltransferase 1
MGPMTQWWIAGFDEGENAIIGFSSDLGDYFLMRPSEEYAPYMVTVTEKIIVTKLVIEFLQSKSEDGEEATYEDLLAYLEVRRKWRVSCRRVRRIKCAIAICFRVENFPPI